MASYPQLQTQQETNRRILEDLQLKKQLIQKGASPMSISLSTTQPLSAMTAGQPFELSLISSPTLPRPAFNPTTLNTTGFFIPQDSAYGNSFIPVLPRLDPLPPTQPPK